jgi:thioredoxin-related protein
MYRVLKLLAVALTCALISGPGYAVPDFETGALPDRHRELLVVEIDNCIYCSIFRRDVVPTYMNSERARQVPMRFVDINAPDVDRLALAGPIDRVPTVLVIEDGREIGRIVGYVGPENFFHSLSHLLSGIGP